MVAMNLQTYIDSNGLKARILSFSSSTNTVEESCKLLGCEPQNIVKSIVVTDRKGSYYLILLQGDRKIKTGKLKKLLMVKDIKLATPSDVKNKTGYNVGDVPPISIQLPVIIDELVLSQEKVFTGGGKSQRLLEITVNEIMDLTHPLVADVSAPI
jgi:prolyl-tRNA editing enzyme YbaK/EbsC (Cys-tRNA(Pro) deacylase)